MIISVIGGSKAKPEQLALAEAVGRELAKRGVMVACGGLQGVMEAVCKGAKSAGGTTIGILPGRTSKEANSYVDIPIVTTMGFSRNVIVVNTGDAVIAIGGAFGTLSEIAYALADGVPVIALKTWPLTIKGDGDPIENGMIQATDPVDAVEKALAAANARSNSTGAKVGG
ncbi:MAG: TIGR00725 family protein [Chloroflexi bacterium]|nr:TIGR00725 family protein [Chloroflexota bacterium]PKB57484.1 MAG: TIGR00725 family protein [SAR202 cluster bacterium Casp-Chloro-G3]